MEHHLKLTFATINAYINLLLDWRMPFRFLSISFGFNAIDYESIVTSPAVDNFLD